MWLYRIIFGIVLCAVWVLAEAKSPYHIMEPSSVRQLYTYNGSTLIIGTQRDIPPLKLGKKTLPWITHPSDPNQKITLLAIPYHTSPQSFSLNDFLVLNVSAGDYKKEEIKVAQSKAKPNPKDTQRIAKEREEANRIYSVYTRQRYWSLPFVYPIESVITSPYGSARIFNKEVKSYHSGTDFRAAIGTPIKASNDGIVVIAKERFLSGYSVVIDHGEGIFSMYYHCSKLKVKVGQRVKKGDVIALSGASGRVSGPHLHFSFLVNGVLVDPRDFIESINQLM